MIMMQALVALKAATDVSAIDAGGAAFVGTVGVDGATIDGDVATALVFAGTNARVVTVVATCFIGHRECARAIDVARGAAAGDGELVTALDHDATIGIKLATIQQNEK